MYNDIFFGTRIMRQMLAHIDASNKQRARENAGIAEVNGFDGVERLSIPHKYDRIELGVDGYFLCALNDTVSVYDKDGKFLFECNKLAYYKQGMFFVGNKKQVIIVGKERADEFGYALYHNETKLTEPIFKPSGWNRNFNEFGFAITGMFGKYSNAIINKSGEILLITEDFDHPYLHGVVCCLKDNYINLLSGDVICEKGYSSTLSTKEFIFVQIDSNCVFQINITNGEFTIHGELKIEPPKEQNPIEYPIKKTLRQRKK